MENKRRQMVAHWIKANPCKMEKHHFQRGTGEDDDLWFCRDCQMKIDQVQAYELHWLERYNPDIVSVSLRK